MKAYIKKIVIVLLIFIFSFNLFSLEIPSLDEVFTISNVQEEDLTGDGIISIGLLFSGCTPESPVFNAALKNYFLLKDAVSEYKKLNQYELGEKILELMYEKVLSSYDLNTTEIQVMLTSGKYNCVSSSLLYLALATDFGLDARVQETQKHAFVILYLDDGRKIDVETTNPYGFNPGNKKEINQKSSGQKKYVTVPKSYYSNKIEVSKLKAISVIAKNRCKLMGDKLDYKNAIPLAASAYLFVQKENEKNLVREDFDKLCMNFALDGLKAGQSNQVLDFFEEVYDVYGKTKMLDSRYSDVTYNTVVDYCNKEQYDEALQFATNRFSNVDSKTQFEINQMIFQGKTIKYLAGLDWEKRIEEIKKVKMENSPYTDQNFFNMLGKMEEQSWLQIIYEYEKKEDYLKAAELCDRALQSINSSTINNRKKNCLKNHGILVHNQIVPLINQKKYDEALRILEQALKQNPNDSLLKSDYAKIKTK